MLIQFQKLGVPKLKTKIARVSGYNSSNTIPKYDGWMFVNVGIGSGATECDKYFEAAGDVYCVYVRVYV